ncbi:MAG TPA: ATP-binding protein [Bacilli bacterium]|nr:ATP-binding protein [Bacilli bacterium]
MAYLYRVFLLVLIMAGTAFFGELKMNPFGEQFRFSLGTTCYFFGLIWFRQLRPLETGILVGVFLFVFRSFLEMGQHGGSFFGAWEEHLPSTVFYLIFATMLTATGLRRRLDRPLLVGLIGTLGDFAGNVGELLLRNGLGENYMFDAHTLLILLLFATLRSFFVVGLYNMLMIRHVRALGEERKQQVERLLLINSSLYEEGFYVEKSMRHIEHVTRSSYSLYKDLRASQLPPALSTRALQIAEEVHELKKDSQRILAGLGKLMRQEAISERIHLAELIALVIGANRKYADMLGKKIHFSSLCELNLQTSRVYALVSILNNLVANAVEAIEEQGRIGIEVDLLAGEIEWLVWDNGPGITPEDAEFAFQPGFTTKYDPQGNPSTGIGLTHCRDLVATLQGTLAYREHKGRTCFVLRMPSSELLARNDHAGDPTKSDS